MKLRIFFFVPAYCLLFPADAQQTDAVSHYVIHEVRLVENNARFFSEDKPAFHVDPQALSYNAHDNLGELLTFNAPALIRSYGPSGSLASVSLRGTGTNHTQVSWNGFPINSPATGQADLSLVPAGFMQQVDVVHGASGALYGSGTFGGSVNMANKPDWENRANITWTIDGGSFSTLNNRLWARVGNRNIQYHVAAIHQEAENDFRYTDRYKYGRPVLFREHNAYHSTGLMQNVFLNLPEGHRLEAGCWYQQKTLELPALMGNYSASNVMQKDSTLKLYLTYRKLFEKSGFVLKSAYFTDNIRYTDKINPRDEAYSIDSKIGVKRWLNELEYRYYLSEKLIIGACAAYNNLAGSSNNYHGRIREHELSFSAFLKITLGKWIGNLGLRREYYEGTDPGLLYTAGWRFKASESLIIRTHVSNKFRKPAFNEKYWQPGGNPDLRPEKGWGTDAGIEGRLFSFAHACSVRYSVTGFFQRVDNWIQWVIQDSLTPIEYKTIRALGAETELSCRYKSGETLFMVTAVYNLNRSIIAGTYDHNPLYEGNQLMYIPLHAASMNLRFIRNGLTTALYLNASGKRETVDSHDETLQLPAYLTANAMAGFEKKYRYFSCFIGIRAENLMNASYEIIRAYPMPGRAFYLTLSVGLDRQQTNH